MGRFPNHCMLTSIKQLRPYQQIQRLQRLHSLIDRNQNRMLNQKQQNVQMIRMINSRREFAEMRTPPSMGEPDRFYRRPPFIYDKPVDPNVYIATWGDAQAPEPILDEYFENDMKRNLLHFSIAWACVGAVILFLRAIYKPNECPAIEQVFPFNNLRLESGGPQGAKSTERFPSSKHQKTEPWLDGKV